MSSCASLICLGALLVTQAQLQLIDVRLGQIEDKTWPVVYTPAFLMAIEQFLEDCGTFRSSYNISWNVRYKGCKLPAGVDSVMNFFETDGVDAVVGGSCSKVCLPSGYFLRFWNVPFFPSACVDPAMSIKDRYPTVVRVMPSIERMASAIVSMCGFYGWKQIVIFTETEGLCEFGAQSMVEALRAINVTVTEWVRAPGKPEDITAAMIDNYVERIRDRGRIVVMCHDEIILSQMMLRADDMGMTGSDYAYFYYGLIPYEFTNRPWSSNNIQELWDGKEDTTEEHVDNKNLTTEQITVRRAFKALRPITMADMYQENFRSFNKYIDEMLKRPPWNFPNASLGDRYVSSFLFDATYAYLLAVNASVAEGKDWKDGRQIVEQCRGMRFMGKTGEVILNDDAVREPNFWVYRYEPSMDKNIPFAKVHMTKPPSERFILIADEAWGTADGVAPIDVPKCGFQNEFCPEDDSGKRLALYLSIAGGLILVFVAVGLVLFQRKKNLESELLQRLWYVPYEELEFLYDGNRASSFRSFQSASRTMSRLSVGQESDNAPMFENSSANVANLRGVTVYVKRINCKSSVMLGRDDLLELKWMRELNHENLNPFVGACSDSPNVCIITNFCDKGTLQDILENDDIKLDWMFKSSLIQDAINGMVYIHHSKLHSHGNLKSSTCAVDGRWVLKIAAYGLKAFQEEDCNNETEYKTLYNRLWTAPEILRGKPGALPYGSQKGDVYSFGILLQEILTREPPYYVGDLSPKEILGKVKEEGPKPYRPEVKVIDNEILLQMMRQSWAEKPENRPSFMALRTLFRATNKGRKTNIMDTMISKLEKYANNLEDIVSKRTAELVDEKKKTDTLLYRMLPKSVALRLKNGETLEAELYDSVTIYFSDIVGFTSLSSESTPFQVVQLLNDLYTLFDGIIDTRDVYKVETIGDAYMVCSGVPQRNGKRHVAEIALMALELLRVIQKFKIQHRPGLHLKLRSGLHTGPCAAGVVGQTMPRYCLFGDTVNMASRMESNGEALKIHMSGETNEALKQFSNFITEERGLIPIKGKGEVMTYWLLGCKDQKEQNNRGPHETIA